MSKRNPFQITSPEGLTAEEANSLFVDVFSDFQSIIDPGHVLILGPRGAGKSMMFRYLRPDCQCLVRKCELSELPYIGFYFPLKNADFIKLSELTMLENKHASNLINEHILVTYMSSIIFSVLANYFDKSAASNLNDKAKVLFEEFCDRINHTSIGEYQIQIKNKKTNYFGEMSKISEKMYLATINYVSIAVFQKTLSSYTGPLLSYLNFLYPILKSLLDYEILKNPSIYLMLDDAHFFTETQTRIINTWLSTRTSREVSLKISSEYSYKTYYTTNGAIISTPHDYSEIDISTVYTGNMKSKYRDRISDIIKKRLELFGISGINAENFFPEDVKQEEKIKQIAEEYKKRYEDGKGRGYYRSDDANRYARPEYIRRLGGTSKSSGTYSYAGFNQLVHLSSGIVRFFLESAHKMYAKAQSESPRNELIKCIPQSIQNDVVREEANHFLFADFEKFTTIQENQLNIPEEEIFKLLNLINALGSIFHIILISDRSERRVFSIAFSDKPSKEVQNVLNLGVQLGYFQKSTIGRKDSSIGGRTRLYVLNKKLAPIWNLDPTGFAGYLFVTNSLIESTIINPTAIARRIGVEGLPDDSEIVQLELFAD